MTRTRWILLGLSIAATVWTVAVAISGGFVVEIAGLRVSSRRWLASALLAAISAFVFCATSSHGLAADMRAIRQGMRRAIVRSDPRVAVAIAMALALVVLWVRGLPFWLDEEMAAINVRARGMLDLGGGLWLGQSAPLGWLVAERTALVAFGEAERALRVVPLAFGLATIGAATAIARRWLGAASGTLFVVLVGTGPWLAYHATELKPYSADACWALVLPAMAAWSVEGLSRAGSHDWRRRMLVWWGVAAVGLWFANGAIFVTPACAAVLVAAAWRHHGWTGAAQTAAPGLAWVASFAACYGVSLRYTQGSSYLQGYWAFALPSPRASLADRLIFIARSLPSLAAKPVGSSLGAWAWLAAAAGWLLTRHRLLGALAAGVPLSAGALGALGVVPLFERLSLWTVPAAYLGWALLVDRAETLARRPARLSRSAAATAAAMVLGAVGALVSVDVVRRGTQEIGILARATDNHALDDRAAIAWLLAAQRPGDALVTTHLGLPAVWWYGRGAVSASAASGDILENGLPVLEVGHATRASVCDAATGLRALDAYPRVLVYLGFRFDDVPKTFDAQLLASLKHYGVMVADEHFGSASRVVVVERASSTRGPESEEDVTPFAGCLTLATASRW